MKYIFGFLKFAEVHNFFFIQVTCQLLGVVFEEITPQELQTHATVRPSVVELLLEIAKYCDLYLMETVLDDKSEV
jgi:hypothetical protein